MNISDTFALNSPVSADSSNAAPYVRSERKDSGVKEYAARTASNLRSIVERRFTRMNEAHDRIRMELLGHTRF